MAKRRWTTLLLIIIAFGMLGAAVLRIDTIVELRREYELEPSDPLRDNEAFSDLRLPTVALFTFRSLAIDYLWARADRLKNEGQYFDALHLARAICALQPNLPSVWEFNAWNMAYNISVGLPTAPERWNWIKAGYELLRDEGIPYNRQSLKLYHEISWIFQHKIGGITDDWNRYYKWRLAYEISPMLDNTTDNDEYDALAESPRTFDGPSCPPIRLSDITDLTALVIKLQEGQDALSKYIYDNFPKRISDLLAEYDDKTGHPSQEIQRAIVLELNKILVGDLLYDSDRFIDVKLSKATTDILAKNPQGFDLIRVNRILLEEAYPNEIAKHKSYTLGTDPEVIRLIERIKGTDEKLKANQDIYQVVLNRKNQSLPELTELVNEVKDSDAFKKLDLFVRARELRKVWKLEPLWIIITNQSYGPINYDNPDEHLSLDWRSAFTHSIYWAMRGLHYVEEGQHSFDELRLRRKIYHGLQDLRHYGLMQIYIFQAPPKATKRQPGQEVLSAKPVMRPRIFLSQDLRMFPIAYQMTLDIIQSRIDAGDKMPKGVIDGSENLALGGIVDLYLAGHRNVARKYWNHLKKRFPEKPRYSKSLEHFLRKRMAEEIADITPKFASNVIKDLLGRSFASYAIYDDDSAAMSEERARQIHVHYNKEFGDEATDRTRMPDFPDMRWLSLVDFIRDPMMDPDLKSALMLRLEIEKPKQFEKIKQELQKTGSYGNAPNQTQ